MYKATLDLYVAVTAVKGRSTNHKMLTAFISKKKL